MLKRTLLPASVLLLFAMLAISQTAEPVDSCTPRETREKCKQSLDPFKYDAGKIVRIVFKEQAQQQEYEIPLYIGEKYRFVFQKEGLPQDVEINVYDKMIGAKNRSLLFSSKGKSFDEKEIIWEPEKSRRVYVHFDIPPTTDVVKKGCVIFLLGYAL